MEAGERSGADRDLSFTSSVSNASVLVEGRRSKAWKGDGYVKDTDHHVRHHSRHPGVSRNCWEHSGCIWRDAQCGRG
jgi:hypothetical protein